jgi:hypothetical protein
VRPGQLLLCNRFHTVWCVVFVLKSGHLICVSVDGNFGAIYKDGEYTPLIVCDEVFNLMTHERDSR